MVSPKIQLKPGSLAILFLLILVGCSSTPMFPTNGAQALHSNSDFGMLTMKPDVYQGRAIKMAGRIVEVETTENGTRLLADWLPYPNDPLQGPIQATPAPKDRFELFYPGEMDDEGLLPGNKFLVIGKIESESLNDMRVRKASGVPFIAAQCLHVWKTGSADIDQTPDLEYAGYPLMQQTYCLEI